MSTSTGSVFCWPGTGEHSARESLKLEDRSGDDCAPVGMLKQLRKRRHDLRSAATKGGAAQWILPTSRESVVRSLPWRNEASTDAMGVD